MVDMEKPEWYTGKLKDAMNLELAGREGSINVWRLTDKDYTCKNCGAEIWSEEEVLSHLCLDCINKETPAIFKVTPGCQCGCQIFHLIRLDSWEDRVTMECVHCKSILDIPLGVRSIEAK